MRYLNSFGVSLGLHISILALLFIFSTNLPTPKIESKPKAISINLCALEISKPQSKGSLKGSVDKAKSPEALVKKPPKKPIPKKITPKKHKPKKPTPKKPIQKRVEPLKKKVVKTEQVAPKETAPPPQEPPLEEQNFEEVSQESTLEESTQSTQEQNSKLGVANGVANGVASGSRSTQSIEQSYVDQNIGEIVQLLRDNLYYPRRARKSAIEGEVVVKFHLFKDRSVSNIEVISSPSAILSRAAIETIENLSGKFPTPSEKLILSIPIRYSLRN